MALLAEEIVEEWLNRCGFFTIRGARVGVNEADILAVRPGPKALECRHVEVQASVNPVSYITHASKAARKGGLGATSAKSRSPKLLSECVEEWCEKKFFSEVKRELRNNLARGPWTYELVVHRVKHPEELDLIRAQGVQVRQLDAIVDEMLFGTHGLSAAAGASLIDLIGLRADRRAAR